MQAKTEFESSGGDLDTTTSVTFQQRNAKLQEGDAELEGRKGLSAAEKQRVTNPAEYSPASVRGNLALRHLKLLTRCKRRDLDTTTSVVFNKDEPSCRKGT